ncbi:MAG: hypothetical protein J6M95_03690 [Bacilli bacterium]|nr:hypothetical protein [Bacilli bacterium]
MKKKIPLLLVVPALFSLIGCNGQSERKVYIDYGRVQLDSYSNALRMTYFELEGKIKRKESFVMVISKEPGSCGCWDDFEPILVKFNKKYNLDIRHTYVDDIDIREDKFGLYTSSVDMPSIAFFDRGQLIRQVTYGINNSRSIFKDESGKALEEMFFQNAYLPKMYYLEEETLQTYIGNNKDFNLYIMRSECGDCSLLGSTVLYDWNLKTTTVNDPLYVFDIQKYWVNSKTATKEEIASYQAIKNLYKLSEEGDPTLGYSTGMVPTLQRRRGNEVTDMCVVYNDSVDKENLTISQTYFTSERINNLKFLEGTGDKYVLQGKELSQNEIDNWRGKTQPSLHDPIAKLFIDYYIK